MLRREGVFGDVENHDVADNNFWRIKLGVRDLTDEIVDPVGNGSA